MKKLLAILLLVSVAFVYANEEKLGKQITIKEKTAISKILAAPNKFEGKTVLVEGKILEVCQDKGCWIEIAGAKENEKIKVKVEDGVIIFPKEAKGKTALVQGVVAPVKAEECESGHEKKIDSKEAEHKHDKTDASKEKEAGCCSKDETVKAYQIQGIGAVIK